MSGISNAALFVAGVLAGITALEVTGFYIHPDPKPVSVVEMPVADPLKPVAAETVRHAAAKPDAATAVSIRFVSAPRWKVSHGPWGAGQFGDPGFTAFITPPTTGYGDIRCEARDANGIVVGASYDNWINAHSTIEKIPYFDLIGVPVSVVCWLRSEP